MDENGTTAAADQLTGAGLRMLAGTIVDNAGITRTKVIPAARLRQAAAKSPAQAVMRLTAGSVRSPRRPTSSWIQSRMVSSCRSLIARPLAPRMQILCARQWVAPRSR